MGMWQLPLSIVSSVVMGGLGAATLLYGRRYFWLAAAGAGFATAAAVADYLAPETQRALSIDRSLLYSLLVASICGAVARWLPRFASMLVGFGVGAYGVVALLAVAALALPSGIVVLLAIAAGAVCARYATWDVDQALIIFSVLLGAGLLVRALPLSRQSPLSGIVWLSLLLAGIIIQYSARLHAAAQATARDASP